MGPNPEQVFYGFYTKPGQPKSLNGLLVAERAPEESQVKPGKLFFHRSIL